MNWTNYKYCDWCNFNSENESELEKHVKKYYFTHTHNFMNQNIQKVKVEISEMKENGFVLKTMAMADFQQEHGKRNLTYRTHY